MPTDATQWTCSLWADQFQQACRLAASSDNAFASFRREPYICGVIETRPVEWLSQFLAAVQMSGEVDMQDAIAAAETNDRYGDPVTGEWCGHRIATTTAAYLLQYVMAKTLFGPLEQFRIAEIGGGYGGMASIFAQLAHPAEFVIYDLPDPLSLARRFLSVTCPDYPVVLQASNEASEIDLLVSCCALSELNEDGQIYYRDILKRSARGLVTWSVTEQSLPWAKDMSLVTAYFAEALPGRNVQLATDSPQFCKAFSWWAPNTIIWGHE